MTPQFIAHCDKLSDKELLIFALEIVVSNAARGHDVAREARQLLEAGCWINRGLGSEVEREIAMQVAFDVKQKRNRLWHKIGTTKHCVKS